VWGILACKHQLLYSLDMELEYTYWESKDGWFVGYLNIWPDHLTQGKNIPELEEMLRDLYEFYKEEQAEVA
jgi:predicted RNase H-like HicB family nuclease